MARFIPTLAQVEEAAKQLPSPYSVNAKGPDSRYRVMIGGWSMSYEDFMYRPFRASDYASTTANVIDFEVETKQDEHGSSWCKWVYRGAVAVQ